MNKQISLAILLMCGLFMITSHLQFSYAAEEGKEDKGSDSQSKNDESNDESSSEKSSDSSGDNDKSGDSGTNNQDDQEKEKEWTGSDKSIDQGSPLDEIFKEKHEKEKAAIEDHEEDKKSDSELPNLKPDRDIVFTKKDQFPNTDPEKDKKPYDDPNEYCDIDKCYGPGAGENSQSNCLGKYCGGDQGQPDEKDYCKYNSWDHKKCGGDHPKCGKWNNWCKHDGDDWDHDHDHHHNNWCSHHECHHHNHHSNTHFSDNHHGDVTVKVHVTDYQSNDLNDVHLLIGDVYEKNLDLSSEPDTIKVDNLDIDGGDDFAVCLANEDSDEGDCVVTHADSDHDTVEVKLKVL